MVDLMLSSTPKRRQHRRIVKLGMCAGGSEGQFRGEDVDGESASASAYHDREGNSSKCFLCCAIALGALAQGCSLEFVSCCSLLDTIQIFINILYIRYPHSVNECPGQDVACTYALRKCKVCPTV